MHGGASGIEKSFPGFAKWVASEMTRARLRQNRTVWQTRLKILSARVGNLRSVDTHLSETRHLAQNGHGVVRDVRAVEFQPPQLLQRQEMAKPVVSDLCPL